MQHYRIFGYSLKYLPAICPYGRLFSLTGLLLHITVFLFSFPVLLLDWPPESPDNQYHLFK
ncbi:hypothetical protein D0W59_22720 [Escherichia coli]|nr:hypothetical protein [Escherichia coli]EFN8610056.1 hypothetical protein [Escherichia coli O83:H28]EEV6134474.1 hypothetical protein [Escherichia coli]EEV8855616.1 hypothetical protein [Escherichia coli]EEW1609562.1 hypothetical protein [Escherichia coli]